jgi:hypothetical protein
MTSGLGKEDGVGERQGHDVALDLSNKAVCRRRRVAVVALSRLLTMNEFHSMGVLDRVSSWLPPVRDTVGETTDLTGASLGLVEPCF